MDNARKGKLGENYVKSYYRKRGFKVMDRQKGEKGFDILAVKGRKKLKVEVKTTKNQNGGVPDMHHTEFRKRNGKWLFVADRLCIVRIKSGKFIKPEILTRQQVDKYSNSHKTVIRVRTTQLDIDLKNKRIKLVKE